MSEYDFVREADDLWKVNSYPLAEAALRRAYAAGQASGGGSDLDRLVTLAAGILATIGPSEPWSPQMVAEGAANTLSALKAQAVKP